MKRLGYTLLILLGSAISVCARAQCTIPAGSNSSTIQTAIDSAAKNTCAGPVTNEALFSAGTYSLPFTTGIGIPCPTSAGVIVTGPTTTYDQPGVLNAWAARPTATINNTTTGESPQLFFTPANCTNPVTITYLEVNGNRPTSGGGAVFISNNGGGPSTPTSNVTIEYNWLHGNQEITPVLVPGGGAVVGYGDTNATEVWLEGFDGGSANNGTFDTNITIDHNIFGNANLSNPSAGDCGNVMTFTGLCTATNPSQFNPPNCTSSTPGGCDTCVFSGYDSSGGECAALGVHTNTSNLHFDFNKLLQEEQGTKWYEAGSGGASSPFSLFFQINDTMSNNDIGLFHRIATEDQQSSVTDATVPAATPCSTTLPNGACMQRLNNDVHDNFDAAFGTWGFSLPNIGFHNEVGNVMISNDGAGPADFEFWGFGTGNNNLDQGSNACAFSWGFTSSEMTIKNNIFQMANGGGCSTTFAINNEEGLPVSDQPAISGNTNATTVSQLASASPSMSPAGGTFTGPVTVTLTDNGNTSGLGPQGNTGIWCTPDGTNPVPKTGSAVYYPSGFQLTISQSETLSCVGMWGAQNQPAPAGTSTSDVTYPSGFGYLASPAVKANFVVSGGGGGTTPTLSSFSLSGTSAILVGGTTQLTGTGTLSNGSMESVTPTAFTSSNTAVATVSSAGLVTGVSAGTASITATFSGVTSSGFTVTVSTTTNTPEGFFLGTLPTANVNTMTVGGPTLQFETVAFFANGAPNSVITPDSYSSSNTAVCTVTNAGLVTAVSAGSCNITATTGGVNSSFWTITVSNAAVTPTTATPTFSPGQENFTGSVSPVVSSTTSGATISCSANGGTATTAASPATFGPFTATTSLACTATSFGDATSASATATYTLQSSATTVATPTFSPGSETFSTSVSPVVSSSTSGATISCSANGGAATSAASPATFGPFTSTTSLACSATAPGDIASASATSTYTFSASTGVVATPTFSPGAETFPSSVSPVVSSATSGAIISCTANGSPLATHVTPATFGPFTGTTTLTCSATASGETQSQTVAVTYTLVSNAPTTTLTPSMTAAQIQTAINNTPSGGTVLFSAGTYSLSAPIALQCGLTYTGPANSNFFANAFAPGQDITANTPTQPTAIIDSTQTGSNIFLVSGCPSTGPTTTLEWIWGQNTGLIDDDGSANNIAISHNWCTNISPNTLNTGSQASSCVFIDGDSTGSSTSNILINDNQLGDAASCGEVFTLTPNNTGGTNPDGDEGPDWGGHCAGVFVNTGVTNLTIENNFFYHMEELVKVHQAGTFGEGNAVTVCDNCVVRFNLMYEFKRIMVENQASVDSGANGFNLSDNAAGWGVNNLGSSFGWSMACCQSNINQTGPGADPADFVNDDLIVVSPDTQQGTILFNGCECWGVGLQMNNNFFEGQMLSYFLIGNGSSATGTVTFGNPIWQATNNYICSDNNPFSFNFYNNEGEPQGPTSQSNTPTNLIFNGTGNPFTGTAASGLGNTACTQQVSGAPTISPPGGSFSGSQQVELNNSATNTTTWFTTDGSTPVPGQGTTKMYEGPFTISSTTTVKAIGMWGQSPQPLSYIADKVDGTAFGFVPSSPVTAVFTATTSGGTATPTFNPGSENFTGSVSPVVSSTTSGAVIDCTENDVPVTGSASPKTLGPFTETTTVTCTATAGGVVSSSATAAYTLSAEAQAAAPTITPDGGPYQGTLSVSLTSTTPGATFNCTTNGSTPTESSPVETGFTLTGTPASETISCIASANGFAASPVTSATFTSALFLGNPVQNTPGTTAANKFNAVLGITGSNAGGYSVSSCTLNQGSGTVTNGANTDCLVVLAPTATTEASTPLCKATFTNTSAVGANPTIPLSGCGTLGPNTLYWVLSITNDPLSSSSYGFSDCPPSGCTGGPPTAGQNSGTYPGFTAAGTYGVYTALPTTLTEGVDQPSQFITLAALSAQTATPVIAPPSGTFSGSQTVTITDSTSGSDIFFCLTAGCTPSPSSTQYTGPFTVSTTTTVTAIATSSGDTQSAPASQTYTKESAAGFNVMSSGATHSSGTVLTQ